MPGQLPDADGCLAARAAIPATKQYCPNASSALPMLTANKLVMVPADSDLSAQSVFRTRECDPKASRLHAATIGQIIDLIDKKFGWGTWIRTKIDGVRVRCSTIELFPSRPLAGWRGRW